MTEVAVECVVRWSGGRWLSVAAASLSIVTTTATVARAQTFTLRVAAFTAGDGVVTSSPAGINCTSGLFATSGTCGASFPAGTVVTLTATPATQNTLGGWAGACSGTGTCEVTLNKDVEVGVTFVPTRYTVTLVAAGNGTGGFAEWLGESLGAPPIVCGVRRGQTISAACTTQFPYNKRVRLSFDTNAGGTNIPGAYSAPPCSSSDPYGTCGALITGPTTITVTILAREFRVKSGSGGGSGTVVNNGTGNTTITCALSEAGVTGACGEIFDTKVPSVPATLTAVPAAGSRFVGWSGACSGTGTCVVSADYPPNVPEAVATFALAQTTYRLHVEHLANYGTGRITSSPAGIDCTFANLESPFGGPACDVNFPAGTTVTLTGQASNGGTFVRWSGDCTNTGTTCQVVMDKDRSVSSEIQPLRYTVTLTNGGNGAGRVDQLDAYGSLRLGCNVTHATITGTCTSQYPVGTKPFLEVTENPDGSSKFASFSVAGAPCIDSSCLPVITGPTTIGIRFIAQEFTVAGSGSGRGRVTGSSPSGIDCLVTSASATGVCAFVHDLTRGSPTTFVATADPGSRFVGWEGVCSGSACSFLGDYPPNARTVVARFELVANQTLTVSGAGSGSGAIESSPGGIGCVISAGTAVNACSAGFTDGTTVTLTATPNAGSRFAGWDGACGGTTTCSLTMSAARAVTARFELTTATLAVAGTGSGSIASTPNGIACTFSGGTPSGTCAASFSIGAAVALTASPASGWTFAGWGGACSGSGSCQLTMSENRSVSASFTRNPVVLTLAGSGTGNGIVTTSPGSGRCVITNGAAAASGCSVTLDQNTSVTLSADPQFGSRFGGWEGDSCSGTQLTCTVTLSQPRTVTARFVSPHAAHDVAMALLGQGTLTPDERAQLDRFGNKDGTFNLGDLLALMDRTGEKLSPATASALMSLPQSPPALATPRRAP